MNRTKEALGDLVDYEAMTAIRPLEPLRIEKGDIPKYILCPAYEKAQARSDRTMERYTLKVDQLNGRLDDSQDQIDSLERTLKVYVDRTHHLLGLNKEDADEVAKHNDAIDQARRTRERIDDAINRHNDLALQTNDAVEESREKLAELNEDALTEIDKDFVAALDKFSQIANKLSEQEDSDDLTAALETCFIALKTHSFFEEHINDRSEQQQAQERVSEINKLLSDLCGNADLRNSVVPQEHLLDQE